MTNDKTIKKDEIEKKVEELRNNLLRDIEKIHKETYEKVKDIMKENDKEKIEKIKKDLNTL